MENYQTNSQKSKEEPKKASTKDKKIEKVVIGEVERRKPTLGKRFMQTFGGGDARGVGSYIMWDVLLPAAKDTIADAVSQGVERMIFGESRSSSRRGGHRPGGPNGYTSYNRMSDNRRDDPRPTLSRQARSKFDFDEIVLNTRVEAEEVVDKLFEIVSSYGAVTVADLYELVGITGSFTDNKYGWVELRGSGVERVRNGYLLNLPRPSQLD